MRTMDFMLVVLSILNLCFKVISLSVPKMLFSDQESGTVCLCILATH